MKPKLIIYSVAVSGEILGHNQSKVLVFPSPTGYNVVISFGFPLQNFEVYFIDSCRTMSGKNRQLVADEPVEFEK